MKDLAKVDPRLPGPSDGGRVDGDIALQPLGGLLDRRLEGLGHPHEGQKGHQAEKESGERAHGELRV